MTKLSLGVLTLAFALNSMAGIFPHFTLKQTPPFAEDEKCANFSGTWTGSCHQQKEETITIAQQSCSSLTIKEFPIPLYIGADNVYQTTIPVGGALTISSVHWSGTWNADKSNLLINIGSNTRTVPSLEAVNFSMSAKVWMKVDGDTLLISSQEGNKPVVDCTYKKP